MKVRSVKNQLKKLERQISINKKDLGMVIDYYEWERMTDEERKQIENRYINITIIKDFSEQYEEVEGIGLVHIWELENYTNKEENL